VSVARAHSRWNACCANSAISVSGPQAKLNRYLGHSNSVRMVSLQN